jgi:putative selenate reductase
MAELIPAPFADLVTRLHREPEVQDSLFDLPRRSWYLPPADAPDLSVQFHGQRAGNPVGPASGPQTQMAQNLVLSYIAGSRIMELKTVQVMDRLEIPRPCIDMETVGYNVEWSQELRVEESLREYVAGMMLITMLRHHMPELAGPAGDVIYDLSVGYDLQGIQSGKVQRYLDGMRDASSVIASLRDEIPARFAHARDLPFQTQISSSLTLSTFHGCPTHEIERICEFLLGERALDVIVKMNPPTLGREELEYLLHDVMGYDEIRVAKHAYEASQTFDEAIEMVKRLSSFAKARGRRFGCKFSNTLEVENHRSFFPGGNNVMYLSGTPLHVITMALTARFRQAMPDVPISFSAGIDATNFADAVACGFVPVTTCSDLLKTGGYGRLPAYLNNLAKRMQEANAATIPDFIRSTATAFLHKEGLQFGDAPGQKPAHLAGVVNTLRYAELLQADNRYHASVNKRAPKKIDSHLVLFDCLTCDKCVPVCPNDANFTYPAPQVKHVYRDITLNGGTTWQAGEEKVFELKKKHQIANYAEFCNECGNCDTFCPEYGGPYIEKPSFFRTLESWTAAAPRDGFVVLHDANASTIHARIRGTVYQLTMHADTQENSFRDSEAEVILSAETHEVLRVKRLVPASNTHEVNIGLYHSLRYLLQGILDQSRLNQINVAFV